MTTAEPVVQPTRFDVAWGVATDCGLRRSVNEDGYLAQPPVFLVADGMGGHDRGDAAARAVVEAFRGHARGEFLTPEVLHEAVVESVARVRSIPGGRDDYGAPGSTVTGVGLAMQQQQACWLVFNVGDSRTYRLNRGTLEQVSVDHSEVQELLEAGRIGPEEARRHVHRSVITRAIGAGLPETPVVDQWLLLATTGDRLLLCSDGLTSELTEQFIQVTLSGFGDPQSAAEALVRAAVEAGGRDNVTAIVVDAVHVGSGDPEEFEAETLGEALLPDDTLPLPPVLEVT